MSGSKVEPALGAELSLTRATTTVELDQRTIVPIHEPGWRAVGFWRPGVPVAYEHVLAGWVISGTQQSPLYWNGEIGRPHLTHDIDDKVIIVRPGETLDPDAILRARDRIVGRWGYLNEDPPF